MGDMGEKTCPLCAEEMDLTDQQLKPCGCGYEICVWCWHHLMDMAEKDDTEGRCPACRAPYDKEKIVGMAARCGRVVTEINMEKKKSQKVKPKPSDGRKQLSTMRVIQRNLVYIVGLPFNLADEDLLHGKEYFGQYGKVLKVSMSRTASGVVQQFPNNTCSVYITYSKEEEAIRCIQSVHGFILDDRCLKACFGTTKYCHAWLRNLPCTNPDCVYLHEVGSQEDSYSKDEVISAYTRSRVPQITDPTNHVLLRTGSKLPPSVDDYCNSTTTSAVKPFKKSASTNSASISSSPLSGSAGRSLALPAGAAWGLRALSQPQMLSNRPSKPKAATVGGSLSSTVTSTTVLGVLHNDVEKNGTWTDDNQVMNGKVGSVSRHKLAVEYQAPAAEKPTITDSIAPVTSPSCLPASKSNDPGTNTPNAISSLINKGEFCGSDKEGNITTDDTIQHLSSDLTSLRVDNDAWNELSGSFRTSSSLSDHSMAEPLTRQLLLQPYAKDCLEPSNPSVSNNNIAVMNGFCVSMERDNQQTETRIQIHTDSMPKVDDDIDSFNSQKTKDPEVLGCGKSLFNSSSIHSANHYRSQSLQHGDPFGSDTGISDPLLFHNRLHDHSLVSSNSFLLNLNGRSGGIYRVADNSFSIGHEMERNHLGRLQRDDIGGATLDASESSVISNILSLDLGKWEESLTSPQSLVRLLGETDSQPSLKTSTSWKAQNSNQSRFSFARQGEPGNQLCEINGTYDTFGHLPENHLLCEEVYDNRNSFLDQTSIGNGLPSGTFSESDIFGSSFHSASGYKPSVPRAQISPPPGFTTTNRAPPPGFSQQEQIDQAYSAVSDKYFSDLSLVRNSHNTNLAGDSEFMDPAILAIGEGRLQASLYNPVLDMESNFLQQMSALENEARLQLSMQRSLSSLQNQRYSEDRNGFASVGYTCGIPSKLFNQPQSSNLSFFDQPSHQDPLNGLLSNGHFNGWNDAQDANMLNTAELLRNEKLGLGQLYRSIYKDSRFQMPSSNNYA